MERFKAEKTQDLKQAINDFYPFLSSLQIAKILSQKDIKVNGTRIKENVQINKNDIVQIYFDFDLYLSKMIEIIYNDENILIANKFQGIEVVSNECEDKLTMEKFLKRNFPFVRAMHRLDLNTKGLVIFALNECAYNELYNAIKNHEITKIYEAICFSKALISPQTFCDILETDKEIGLSKIKEKASINEFKSNNEKSLSKPNIDIKASKNSEKTAILQILKADNITAKNIKKSLQTKIECNEFNFTNKQSRATTNKNGVRKAKNKIIENELNNFPLYHLCIELKTGRTHQIRVQLAYHKIFILGDGKYGDKNANRFYKKSKQMLEATKLKFNFAPTSPLFYLNNKTFSIPFSFNQSLPFCW